MTDTLDLTEFSTTVFVPEDVMTVHGNVIVAAGFYPATPDRWETDGYVPCNNTTIWTETHYAGINRVSLPDWCYTRTEGPPPPIPEHDCNDCLRSDVTSSVFYCGVCQEVLA